MCASKSHNISDDYVNLVEFCKFKGSLYMMIQVKVYIMHTFVSSPILLHKYAAICCQSKTIESYAYY